MKKKKSLFSRIMSMALSFVVGITTLAGFGADLTASAKKVTLGLEQIHGNFWYFWVDSPNGSAFCIQKGVSANSWDEYTEMYKDEYYYDQDYITLTKTQRKALGMAQYYGYPVESKSRAYFCATQAIIWEIMNGERSATTLKLIKTSTQTSELWSDEKAAYNTIVKNMEQHYTVPSFNKATAKLTWKPEQHAYYKGFYDYNDVLADSATRTAFVAKLKAVNGVTNAKVTYDSSKKHWLTEVWASKPVNVKVTADKVFEDLTGKWTDVVIYSNEWRSQALTSGVYLDPSSFSITLSTEPEGKLTVNKTYTNENGTTVTGNAKGTLAAATKFKIKDSTGAYLILTGSAGNYAYSSTTATSSSATTIALTNTATFTVSGMPKGTYTLVETASPTRYAKLANKQFTIKSGATTTKTYNNQQNPSPNDVVLSKEWVDTDGTTMTHSDFVSKYGSSYVQDVESNVEFLAYIVVNGTRYYFTVDYTGFNNANGGSQTAIRSEYNGQALFFKADKLTDEAHWYYNSITNNIKDIYSNAHKFSIANGKSINIGYLFDTFENPAFFGLTAANNKWTDKTVYFEEIINPVAGATAQPISYWSYSPNGIATSQLSTTSVTAGDEGTAYNYKRVFKLSLNKKDGLTLVGVGDADYTLYDSEGNEIETVTTDADGKATFTTLVDSTKEYTIKETRAPKNYLKDTTEYIVKAAVSSSATVIALSAGTLANTVSGNNDLSATGNLPEQEKFGTLNIEKTDNLGNTVSGITFDVKADVPLVLVNDTYFTKDTTVAGTLYAAGAKLATLTTNAQGKASITNLALDVTYTVTETSEAAPYVKVENTQSIKLVDEDDTGTVKYIEKTLPFVNTVQEVEVNVIKKDSKDGGNLEGAKFVIKAAEDFSIGSKKLHSKGDTICTLTTDENGFATNQPDVVGDTDADGNQIRFKMYAGAKYTITETTAPTKYVLPANEADRTQTIQLAYDNTLNKFYVLGEYTFEDEPQTASVYVYKLDNESKTIPLSGAEFKLTAAENVTNSLGKVVYAKGATIATVTTGTDGKGKFPVDVPVGFSYTITETKPPKNFKFAAAQTFDVKYNAAVQHVSITRPFYEDEMTGKLTIYKQDGKTKVGLAGAKFNVVAKENILKADGSVRYAKGTVIVKDLTSDANGKAEYSGLYMGEYEVVETKAPDLFNKYKTAIPFELVYTDANTVPQGTVTFLEERQTGKITAVKYDNETKRPLSGAKFIVYPAEDVYDTDNSIYEVTNASGKTVKLTKGTVIDTVTTGTDGKATFPTKLPVGFRYTVEETQAPENFVNKHEQQTFELGYNAEVEFVEVSKSYYNDYQNGTITVTKKDGKYGDLLSGATFDLVTTSAVKKVDGTIKTVTNMKGETIVLDKAGVVIDTLTTDENGVANFTTELPVGYRFKLVETQAPDGYVNSKGEYEFDLTYNATVEYVSITPIINNKPIEVEISKRDADGNELKDAEMQLKDKDGKVIDEWVSDGTNHLVSKLKVGEYTLHEVAAPEGYTIATDITFYVDEKNKVTVNDIEVTAKSDDEIPLIVMYDSATKVYVSKQDMYGKELEGATVQIIDSKGTVVEKWTSTKEQHLVTNLPVGTYTLRETAAPKGYHITTDIVFSIDNKNNVTVNGTKVTATSTDDIPLLVMKDEATKVTFKKVDDKGNNVVGAKLRIVDSNGKVVKEWTSAAAPTVLTAVLDEGLEYTVEELAAPKGYCLAGKFSFKVKTLAELQGTTQEVTITDKPTIVEVSKVSLTGQKEIVGAKMQIIDEDGKVIDEWTSTNVAHVLRAKLEAGRKYYVHEVTPPKGYVFSSDVAFTVSTDGRTDKVKMDDDDTKVAFSKRDAYGNELKGAHLQILDANGKVVVLADKDNNHITEWVSDGTNHVVRNLPAGTYTLKETAAPDGYTIATAIKFTIDEHNIVTVDGVMVKAVSDDEIPLIVMVDEATKVEVHKVDDEGNNLAGATLRIVDNKGNIVKEWVSDEKPITLEAELIAGLEYTLEEIRQPKGYVLHGSFAFTVSTNAQLDVVKFENRPTIVEVSKKALTGEEEIEGATMQILDEDGNVVDEWVSTTTPHVLKAQLEANRKYYVHEVTPPTFYVLSDDVEFTVSDDGSVDEVVMYDDVTRGTIEVHKRTEGGNDVEGIEFVLEGTSDTGLEVNIKSKTDANGVAVFELVPTGTYTITENEETVPYAYLAADKQEVVVEYAKTSSVTFFNAEKTGTIEIHKRTEGDLNLEGIEFILTGTSDSGREISVTATTDENGLAVFENIPVGTYIITENGETVPAAYLAAEPTEVTVEYAATTTAEISNAEKTGSIKLQKRTENMTDIANIEFILTGTSDSGRKIRMTVKTDKNGVAVFESVPIGTYVITENGDTVPSGYLVADAQEVTVYSAKESSVTFENKKQETPNLVTPNRPSAVTKDSGLDGTATVAFMSLLIPIFAVAILARKRKEDK